MINGVERVGNIFNQAPNTTKVGEIQQNFGEMLNQALNKVNHSQLQSDTIADKFVAGEITNLHDVMIAGQKASITRQLTLEVRDKAVEAYKEIMRMQI